MIIETEEEYQRLCAEYELLKDEDGNLDRKIELADALYKYETASSWDKGFEVG